MVVALASIFSLCGPGGEIGRRKGLKIPRQKWRAGSIPAPGTNYINKIQHLAHLND